MVDWLRLLVLKTKLLGLQLSQLIPMNLFWQVVRQWVEEEEVEGPWVLQGRLNQFLRAVRQWGGEEGEGEPWVLQLRPNQPLRADQQWGGGEGEVGP